MSASAFPVLGLSPTRSLSEVKRAYFAQLALHPPHREPAAFKALRAAYETLSTQASLDAAFASAPLDVQELFEESVARTTERQRDAATRLRAERAAAGAVPRLFERFAELTVDRALESLRR